MPDPMKFCPLHNVHVDPMGPTIFQKVCTPCQGIFIVEFICSILLSFGNLT